MVSSLGMEKAAAADSGTACVTRTDLSVIYFLASPTSAARSESADDS